MRSARTAQSRLEILEGLRANESWRRTTRNVPAAGARLSRALIPMTLIALSACGGGGGRNSSQPPHPPTVSLAASQTSVASGAAASLQWSTTNATSCTASGGWSGTEPTSGSFTSNALTQTTHFTLNCSGPGGSASGSQAITVSQAGATVNSSTTAVISSGAAQVTDGDTKVDFSSDPGLSGATATIQHVSAQAVDDTAAELNTSIATDFSNTTTIRVALSAAPVVDTVHVTVTISALPATPSGSFPAVYVWSGSDANDADGASSLNPLATNYTPASLIVEADIPRYEFRPDSSLGDTTLAYVAVLRVGMATTFATHAPKATSLSPALRSKLSVGPQATSAGAAALVTCPLGSAGCVETSMFNPSRKLSGATGHHNGVDLSAPAPTNLYSIPGGKISQPSRSAAWFTANKSGLSPASIAAGVEIQVQADLFGGTALLKYFHMQDVAGYLKNTADPTGANGGLAAGATVQSDGLIGTSGSTGAAESGGPHLHFELWLPTVPLCKNPSTALTCSYGLAQVDPFPYMVKVLKITPPIATPLTLASSPFTFPVTASDALDGSGNSTGNPISSKVGHALEITQMGGAGDPTRKVCFYDSASELTFPPFNPVNPPNTGPLGPLLLPSGNYQCAPWGTAFGATSNTVSGSDTTVTAKFTLDPLSPISFAQALSSVSDNVTITGNESVISRTYLFTVTTNTTCSGSNCGAPSGTSTYSDTITLTQTAPNSNLYYCYNCQLNLPNFGFQYPFAQYTTFSLPISVNYDWCGGGSTPCSAYDDSWHYTVDLTGVRGLETLHSTDGTTTVSGSGTVTSIPQ